MRTTFQGLANLLLGNLLIFCSCLLPVLGDNPKDTVRRERVAPPVPSDPSRRIRHGHTGARRPGLDAVGRVRLVVGLVTERIHLVESVHDVAVEASGQLALLGENRCLHLGLRELSGSLGDRALPISLKYYYLGFLFSAHFIYLGCYEKSGLDGRGS